MPILQRFLRLTFWCSTVFAICFACSGTAAETISWQPSHLRCEYLDNPIGIDTPKPRFFWWLEIPGRGKSQTAYQILVASNPSVLARDQGDEWDSGKVSSADTIQIVYKGKPLESGRDYYWKVRSWNNIGEPGPYSTAAHFSMGLLSRDDWKGSWIGGGAAAGNEFRKAFSVDGKVVRARAYITALGYYELHVNGKRVGNRVLDPAWTTYPKRVLYSTYDLTSVLQSGSNAIGVMIGGGWATLSEAAIHLEPYYSSPAFLLQVNIQFADGRAISVSSDGSWKTMRGPVREDSVYNGEIYDALYETPGWDTPGFDDSKWSSAQVVNGSDGVRSAEMMPPILVVDTVVPTNLTSPAPGVYVFDMGQNLSGWASLLVHGPAGAQVTMRYAELLDENGMINRENLRAAKSRDIFILSGHGLESYEPRFTYHGFRYIEVTGFPGTPRIDSVRARVVHTAVDSIGGFVASKQILNDIHKAILWSQATNLFGIPTDCDQRDERKGWLGDAQITADEAVQNFDMAAFYTNFIRDIGDEQAPDGSLPGTAPFRHGDLHADLGWESAYPILAWEMWKEYGDRRILEQNEAGIKKYVAFLRTHSVDNVLHGHFGHEGDWMETEHTSLDYMADIWYFYDLDLLAKIEGTLGNSADAGTYEQLAQGTRDALNRIYFNPDTNQYANGTQTANAMALYLNLPPPDRRTAVAGNLTNDITYYHNTHTTSGFIGVRYELPVLTAMGRSDLAYELSVQTTFPSWGYMLQKGGTTLWELWQDKSGPSMNSRNHIMFGSVGGWFYHALAGIDQEPAGASYERIRIDPQIVEDLRWASATTETIRGTVSSSWTRTPTAITMQVTIPVGANAIVTIPNANQSTALLIKESDRVVWQNGHFVSGDMGVNSARQQGNAVAFSVSAGSYSFKLTGE